jgi:hypothetical protein
MARVIQSRAPLTSVGEKGSIPDEFELGQDYPNPVNPTTAIHYDLPSHGFVSLKVFDVLGREVRTLVNEVQDAGSRVIELDATGLASGVYFYRLIAGDASAGSARSFGATKKFILAK